MRILPISDLHLERRTLKELPALNREFDVMVCAGDIWESEPEKAVQALIELAQDKPVIAIQGNHDFYTSGMADARTMSDFTRLFRDEADRQNERARKQLITVLNADNPETEIDDVRFIGLTLWTDWSQVGRWTPGELPEVLAARSRFLAGHWRNGAEEFHSIKTGRGRFTPYDFVSEHARERAILLDELAKIPEGPTVAITHHTPLAHCADVYREHNAPWWAPAFYGLDLLPHIPDAIRPDLWIFGHVHAPFDSWYGRTRAAANPVEGGSFTPDFVIDI